MGLPAVEIRVADFSEAEIRVADLLAADFPAAGHFVMEILYARTLAFLFHSELF